MAANPRVSNGHRRRQLRSRVLREETHCGICGEVVDKTLHHREPMAPEVDEIIPVSLGGSPLQRSNTRLVHRVCNQRRGDGRRERMQAAEGRAPVVASTIW